MVTSIDGEADTQVHDDSLSDEGLDCGVAFTSTDGPTGTYRSVLDPD